MYASPAISRTSSVTQMAPGGAFDISRADRFTASPRQTNVRRMLWPYVPLRSRPWAIPIWISLTAVDASRSRRSRAAAAARAASSSWAIGDPKTPYRYAPLSPSVSCRRLPP